MKKYAPATMILISFLLLAAPAAAKPFLASNTLSPDAWEPAAQRQRVENPGPDSLNQVLSTLDEMDQPDLADLTGQVGIRIDMSVQIVGGYVSWGDADGYAKIGLNGPGYVTFSDMALNDGMDDPAGPVIITNLTIDAGTNDAAESYLSIGMPSIQGRIAFESVKIGDEVDGGNSLGSIEVGDLSVAASTIKIRPH